MLVSGGSMSKVRVYEVAKQLNLDPKAVVGLFQAVGINEVKNHMSSVELEAVERVKRHLEKQKTHDVVEERIRPGVLKRRAVAKPGQIPDAPPSGAGLVSQVAPSSGLRSPASSVGLAPASSPKIEPSARRLPAAESSPRIETAEPARQNGHVAAAAAASPISSRSVAGEVARAKESGKLPSVRELPEEKRSARDVAAEARAPRDRASARALGKTAEVEAPPASAPSPVSAPTAPNATDTAPVSAHASASPAEEAPEPEAARGSGSYPTASTAPMAPTATAAPTAAAAPPPVEEPRRETATPPGRAAAPKTGVEYWAGRPGVPMPTPSSAPRTAIGGGPSGAMPRRVQYDPRAGAATGMQPRRDVRAGGPQQGRSMMRGAGGAGQRRMFGGAPQRKPSGIVSTQEMSAHKKVIRIDENVTLQSMAQRMSLKSTEVLMKLLSMGMTGVHINTTLDADTARILASEFGWEIEDVAVSEEQSIAAARGEEATPAAPTEGVDPTLVTRPPVVTVMGHVDHGKTSLLDKIRKANVAGGEAGGITQHIGAYKVQTPHGTIVFLDTPGHEAFTQMRARGASVTDLVILVVAADDGVMPQTKEAIAHAKSAKVPIIVAVNKIDKPDAEPERARRELVEAGLQPEEWGGDTIFVNVSAQTGEGISHLLEMVALQAEVLDLRANPTSAASGTVLEALLDRGRGPVARVLVQDGTLRVGDFILAGPGFGKVRAMTNEHGKQIQEAGPSTPTEILGLSDVPGAGDPMHAVKDPKKAQEIAESRRGKMAKSLIPATAKVSLEELSKRIADTDQQELRVIIKGDVQGSVEAVADALAKLSTEKVRLSIIHAGVGAITEGDVNLAIAARAIIVGFNVRPAGKASGLSEENKIEIRLYSIIYNAVDDVKSAMEGLLPPTLIEKSSGTAEVRQLFKVKGVAVAGCYVTSGAIKRTGKARLLRDGSIVWDGKLAALKRFKEDVKDVQEGFECGISLDGYNDIKEKDVIEAYEIEEVKQKL
jgi:translation initiation factor IF-2